MPRKGHTEEKILCAPCGKPKGARSQRYLPRDGCIGAGFLQLEAALRRSGFERAAGTAAVREENRKLKTLVADLTLDKHILQEVLSKKA